MKAQIWVAGGLYRIILSPECHNEQLLLDFISKQEPHFQTTNNGDVSVLVKSLIKEES